MAETMSTTAYLDRLAHKKLSGLMETTKLVAQAMQFAQVSSTGGPRHLRGTTCASAIQEQVLSSAHSSQTTSGWRELLNLGCDPVRKIWWWTVVLAVQVPYGI